MNEIVKVVVQVRNWRNNSIFEDGNSALVMQKSASDADKADFFNKISAFDLYRPPQENIEHLFASYGIDHCFSRLIVMRELGIQRSNAGTFMAKLQASDLIKPVQGEGRGKFRFKH